MKAIFIKLMFITSAVLVFMGCNDMKTEFQLPLHSG